MPAQTAADELHRSASGDEGEGEEEADAEEQASRRVQRKVGMCMVACLHVFACLYVCFFVWLVVQVDGWLVDTGYGIRRVPLISLSLMQRSCVLCDHSAASDLLR